jgi:hypothetical protein
MRAFVLAGVALLLLSGAGRAAGSDTANGGVVFTASPRSSDVVMVVQLAKPSAASDKPKAPFSAALAPASVKSAAR